MNAMVLCQRRRSTLPRLIASPGVYFIRDTAISLVTRGDATCRACVVPVLGRIDEQLRFGQLPVTVRFGVCGGVATIRATILNGRVCHVNIMRYIPTHMYLCEFALLYIR